MGQCIAKRGPCQPVCLRTPRLTGALRGRAAVVYTVYIVYSTTWLECFRIQAFIRRNGSLIKRRAKSAPASRRTAPNPSPPATAADAAIEQVLPDAPKPGVVVTDRGGAVGRDAAMNVVRDSFTMPVVDYMLIGALKHRCIGLGFAVKKSELLRAGLHALGRISDENLAQVVAAVESVKTGRPPGKKKRKKSSRGKDKRQ